MTVGCGRDLSLDRCGYGGERLSYRDPSLFYGEKEYILGVIVMVLKFFIAVLCALILASCGGKHPPKLQLKKPIVESSDVIFEHLPLISSDKNALKGWVIGVITPVWQDQRYRMVMNDKTDFSSLSIKSEYSRKIPTPEEKVITSVLANNMMRDVSKALSNTGAEVVQFPGISSLDKISYGDKKRMHALIVLHPGLLLGQLRESYKFINNKFAVESTGFFYTNHGIQLDVLEPLSREFLFSKKSQFVVDKSEPFRATWKLPSNKFDAKDYNAFQSYSNRMKRVNDLLTLTYNKMLDQTAVELNTKEFTSRKADVMELKGLKRF